MDHKEHLELLVGFAMEYEHIQNHQGPYELAMLETRASYESITLAEIQHHYELYNG
jgi:hypothetical protein